MPTDIDIIELFQPGPAFGVPSPSPFCLKVETWLRMAGLRYRVVETTNPGKGPKGKIPFIRADGRLIGDSEFIVRYLAERHGTGLDHGVPPAVLAAGTAIARMLDDHFYWTGVYSRWIDDRFWPTVKQAFFDGLPPLARTLVPVVVRRKIRRALHAQGTGRHSREEIYAMAADDLAALADFLADKPYFLGDRPTTLDATTYGFLANVLLVTLDTPQKAAARTHANLCQYVARMEERYFPDG